MIVLGTNPLAVIARMTRSAMLEVLGEDYIRTARAKGLSGFRIVAIHALRNALIPVITVIGLQVGVLFTVDYLDRMDLAYAAADLAVCRAGAMTVAELSAVGLPAVYVPLPIGNGEQRRNAAEVVAAGGGLLVADEDMTAASAGQLLPDLLGDPVRLRTMGKCAASQGDPGAAGRLATMVTQAAATRGIR